MEDKPLEDDFTLGDVMETKEPKLTKKTIFILVGIISFIVVVSIIIIIVATSKDSPKPEDSKEEDEKEPTELSKIAQISCTYDISTIKNAINIINDEYVKSSKFYIFINGKNIPFSKKYKFENYGENLVIFDIYENINNIGNAIRSAGHSLGIQAQSIEQLQRVANVTLDKLPKITTMQKGALITDGENVIDTIQIESWRYLMVKNITPSDWNEYAKLDKLFSWELIEVTDWKYDVKVDLGTNTEGETATMTVNIDLLFVKY